VSRLGGGRLASPVLGERLAVVARKPDRLDRGVRRRSPCLAACCPRNIRS